VKVFTELQFTIEAMLRAVADPVTDERHILYQIVVSWNAKLHGLYITLFVAISCSGGDLTIDANSQSAVASQLRRHIHNVIMAGDGPSVLLTRHLGSWPQASKESEQHPGQMPRLLLERGIRLSLRVSGRRGKVKAKTVRICKAGLKTLRAL